MPKLSFNIPGDPAARAAYRRVVGDVPVAQVDGTEIPWQLGFYLWPDGRQRSYPPGKNLDACRAATVMDIVPGDELARNSRGERVVTARVHPAQQAAVENALILAGLNHD